MTLLASLARRHRAGAAYVTRGLLLFLDASQTQGGQLLIDMVGGRSARIGSTTGADAGDPTWVAPNLLQFTTDDYAIGAGPIVAPASECTFEAVIGLTVAQGASGMLGSLYEGTGGQTHGIQFDAANVPSTYFFDSVGAQIALATGTALPTNGSLHHLVARVAVPGSAQLWVDGVLVATGGASVATALYTFSAVSGFPWASVGAAVNAAGQFGTGTQFMAGMKLGLARWYNVKLTDSEVLKNYKAAKALYPTIP